jgi:hypothetical protein
MRRRRQLFVLAVALLSLTGCGISTTGPTTAGPAAAGGPATQPNTAYARLYFVGPYGMSPASRPATVPLTPQQALDLLVEGPNEAEQARGLTTDLPPMHGDLIANASMNAVDVYLPLAVLEIEDAAVSQIACTAAHAKIPGDRPPTEIDVRIHESGFPSEDGVPLRCDAHGNAHWPTLATGAPTATPSGS